MRLRELVLLVMALTPLPQAAAGEPLPVFILKWGTQGSADGQFIFPVGLAVEASGDVYAAHCANVAS